MALLKDLSTCVVVFCVALLAVASSEPGNAREYCSFQKFNATCDHNQVILMTSAKYGRIRLGTCVTENLGYLGCVVDVVDVLDRRCSGRPTCDVSVSDPELRERKPCPNGVTWYLEAAYICVKVIPPVVSSRCHFHDKPVMLNSSHYLSNKLATNTGHSNTLCPWNLMVNKGQTISVSFYNTLPDTVDVCYTVANVIENGLESPLTMCPSNIKMDRSALLFDSKTNNIQLSFRGTTQISYLLKVEVEGCPNKTLPPHTTTKRTHNKLLVTCNNSRVTWTLTCENNKWHGNLGNCSTGAKGPWAMQHIFQDGNILPMGILIAVALGVALGIFLGGLLLVIVGSRMKKRQRQRLQQAALVDAPDYDVRVEAPQRHPYKSPGSGNLSSSMEYTLSRGTDLSSLSESDRPYTYRKDPGRPRDSDQTKRCTSPYHAYETPSLT